MAAEIAPCEVGDRVIFKRGHQTLTGKILAIGACEDGQSGGDRRTVIETEVTDLGGRVHHGKVIVSYKHIVSLVEEKHQAVMEMEDL